jgi:hypothetical protein
VLFLRDNDANLGIRVGNALGHAYFSFYKLHELYGSNKFKLTHRTQLKKLVNERWAFGHNILHSVGFVLHPSYRLFEQNKNIDVMGDLFTLLDMWVSSDAKGKIMSQLSDYKNGRGFFSRSEDLKLDMEPLKYWETLGGGTPELQELAIKVFKQHTSASLCEHNWSSFEYIFNKKRNRLSTDRVEKLVYVHGNLRYCKSKQEVRCSHKHASTSLLKYISDVMSAES